VSIIELKSVQENPDQIFIRPRSLPKLNPMFNFAADPLWVDFHVETQTHAKGP